jgi:hypothetical protein
VIKAHVGQASILPRVENDIVRRDINSRWIDGSVAGKFATISLYR